MFRLLASLFAVLTLLAGPASHGSENWPQWRGPSFNGSIEAKGLPSTWSHEENIVWKTPLPGPSGATPIIHGDRVFVSSLDNESYELVALCFDRKSGKELWRVPMGMAFSDEGRGKNMASPSPVTDGKHVYFLFGTTEFAKVDMDGKVVWRRNLQKDHGGFYILFGYHCSPLLYEGKLYVQVLQRDRPIGEEAGDTFTDSYLLAVDPETGKDLWKQVRASNAVDETRESYATPIPFEHNGRKEILVFGGDVVTGHDPATGKELWRWGNWNPRKIHHWRVVPSPVTFENLIYVCGPKNAPVFAVKGGGEGHLTDEALAWTGDARFVTSDVCVPLLYQDRMYVLEGDDKFLSCLDPRTGEIKYQQDLDATAVFRASPTGADGKIYMVNEEGVCIVVQAGDEYKELARIEMGEGLVRSTISVANNQLFLRTTENLYCIAD